MKNVFRMMMAVALMACVVPMADAKRAPNLEFRNLSGATEKFADLRGSITVVNFWATWCGPCREELPLLSKLSEEYGVKYAQGKVRFVAISADEDPGNAKNRARIEQFLNAQKPAMEVWVGADLDMLGRLGLGNVLPATVVLDEQGEVIAKVLGQAHEEDVRRPLDWLLHGRGGDAPAAVTKRY
ncbi:MAG TPA: TlpA disulfide reductase family protein [Acidobacteriaceae bacterium]|nr:TlpA disulfide reductase family protein [Acidobacteriaceae bacterium]